jgi:hypothetical protein
MKVYWKDAERTILVREASESLIWEDYDRAVAKTIEMLREAKHDVYLILDGSRIEYVPRDSLHYFGKANRNLPSNIAMRILVTRNRLVIAMTGILERVMPDNFENFHYAKTMEEAYEKIAEAQCKR